MKRETMDLLLQQGIFSELDLQFGRFMLRLSGKESEELFLAAVLVSHLQSEGHICLDLSAYSGKALIEDSTDPPVLPRCPKLNIWKKIIEASPVVGMPGDFKPLILDGLRLYLYRYWDYEKRLADILKERMENDHPKVNRSLLKGGLKRLFPDGKKGETDWQRVAAFASVMKRFCVVSGGPGTGKTTTAARILALLKEQAGQERFHVALAAPTGKAAARLQETIKVAREKMDCQEDVKAAISQEASTIHRLLGTIPGSPYFRHDSKNPLPIDIVVIDESSMVDLALLSKLVQALPLEARLILLGDKDQLASVQAGAVLGDICDTGQAHGFSGPFRDTLKKVAGEGLGGDASGESIAGPADSIIQLRKNYRFGETSGIGRISRAVNEGDSENSMRLLKDGACPDAEWRELPRPDQLPRALRDRILEGFAPYLKATEPGEAFRLFNSFRILCALREGPYGVYAVNYLIEQVLREKGLIKRDSRWYRGRPILITRNDYNPRLFNGDVGILLPDPTAQNELRAFFQAADGSLRRFLPLRLPDHETVYAMTVHKSQGSEFDRVLFIMTDRMAPILTRELVYTALTRAKEKVEVSGREEIFREAVSRRIERTSGLRKALWGK
jgi:exodeoxyribonuclease V alpha subunit